MAIIETLSFEKTLPAPTSVSALVKPVRPRSEVHVPRYLRDVYTWAYLEPRNVRLLDREWVVSVILWGNNHRLRETAFDEIEPGDKVLLPASVYGDFVPALARHTGPSGQLDVVDVAPVQVARCRRKLREYPWASVRRGDARKPGEDYDAVCCFFLLHELPEAEKHAVVNALLDSVRPGGKAVFVDYHKPHWAHPLKGLMALVFATLEPFANSLWRNRIRDLATRPERFQWQTETFFGGMYQKTVARRSA